MYSICGFLNVDKLQAIDPFHLFILLFFLQLILEIAEGWGVFIFFSSLLVATPAQYRSGSWQGSGRPTVMEATDKVTGTFSYL